MNRASVLSTLLPDLNKRSVVLIAGQSCTGKTSLATRLALDYGCSRMRAPWYISLQSTVTAMGKRMRNALGEQEQSKYDPKMLCPGDTHSSYVHKQLQASGWRGNTLAVVDHIQYILRGDPKDYGSMSYVEGVMHDIHKAARLLVGMLSNNGPTILVAPVTFKIRCAEDIATASIYEGERQREGTLPYTDVVLLRQQWYGLSTTELGEEWHSRDIDVWHRRSDELIHDMEFCPARTDWRIPTGGYR